MDNYLYLKEISLTRMIVGNIMWITGMATFLFVNVTLGGLLIFFWMFLFFAGLHLISTNGFEINFRDKTYRKVFSIFAGKSGSWKSYLDIEYISLVEALVRQTIGGKSFWSTATATLSAKRFLINVFHQNNKYTILYMTKDKSVALEIAQIIQSVYGVEIKNRIR